MCKCIYHYQMNVFRRKIGFALIWLYVLIVRHCYCEQQRVFETSNTSTTSDKLAQSIANTPRILVVINGQLRGGHIAWDSFKRHLLQYYLADLALLIPPFDNTTNTSEAKPLLDMAKYIWHVPEYSDWGNCFTSLTHHHNDTTWKALCSLKKKNAQFLGGVPHCHPGSGGILLCYRHYFLTKITELSLDQLYDWIIYTRSDYVYLCPLTLSFNTMNRSMIYVPNNAGYHGYTDRFTIIPSRYTKQLFNLTYDLILNWERWLPNLERKNLERLLGLYYEYQGFSIQLFDHVAFTVKRDTDPTRWSAGSDIGKLRPFHLKSKYPSELYKAERTCPNNSWKQLRQIYITYIDHNISTVSLNKSTHYKSNMTKNQYMTITSHDDKSSSSSSSGQSGGSRSSRNNPTQKVTSIQSSNSHKKKHKHGKNKKSHEIIQTNSNQEDENNENDENENSLID